MVATLANIKDNSYENKIRLEQTLKVMLNGMSESNRDGTGIAFAATDGRVFMSKTALQGKIVADSFSLDIDIDYKHFILHTRMATHGATNDMNAHPHETKFGYLVHNGWCPSLYQKHKEVMKTGCDSEALAHVYDPDPVEFEKGLLGSEHFAIIHLDADGSKVHVMNKNKMLYKAHSKVLSADIFLTSNSVISDIAKLLNEKLDTTMIHDGDTYMLDGENIIANKFKFADSGYYGMAWGSGEYGNWSHDRDWYKSHYGQKALESSNSHKPINYNRPHQKETSIPNYVLRMSRKERKRWIRENKEKRDEYVQFWTDHERELSQQESEEDDFRKNGFTILDCDGNVIDEG